MSEGRKTPEVVDPGSRAKNEASKTTTVVDPGPGATSNGRKTPEVEDHGFGDTSQETIFRDLCDTRGGSSVPGTPPVIRLPCCPLPYTNIELKSLSEDKIEVITDVDRSKSIVARLQREKVLAVAAEGINVGKEGPVTLVQIGTCAGTVFIFDILTQRDLIGKGRLRVLMEDENIIKVIHDCSNVSAAFNFQFAVTLNNVFDTQVAHLIISEHQGRQLPSGLKLSEICLQYAESVDKYYTYDWRTDSKSIWSATIGNFWAHRPMTPDMIEFAASDVIVLIPDVYRNQHEYIEANGLRGKLKHRVHEWLQIEMDDVVKENSGRRTLERVLSILRAMHRKYDDRAALFNVLDPDEMNALSLVTYEDAEAVSGNILRLKIQHIMADIEKIEVRLRTDEESWEHRRNILDYLRYYAQIPNNTVKAKAEEVWKEAIVLILEHMEEKYSCDTTPNMVSTTEREALLTIPYMAFEKMTRGQVVSSLYWKFMQDEIHEMINYLRLFPSQFSISQDAYTKLDFFARNTTFIPEEVSSLASALIHAIRYYNAETGSHGVVDPKRVKFRVGSSMSTTRSVRSCRF